MAGQTNRIAVFVFILVATILLCEVYLVSSLPRGYYGFLPRRVLTRDGSRWKSKRMFTSEQIQMYQNCKDKRNDCDKLIKPDMASYWCMVYKGQCDVTCGTASCLGYGGLMCKDVLDGDECLRALLWADKCRSKLFKDGCFRTCCECNKLSPNCN